MSATLGLDAARAVDPARYAIGGTAPRAALKPANRDEVAEALRAAGRDGLAVVPWGGGASLGREPAPARYDLALDLTGLDRVVEYEPEDLSLTAECGHTIESLRSLLAARGQELPIEGANAWAATLGGVLAANASGPRRLRFGAPRDRIVGARFVLADGTLARSGGKVVKNVAGHALHRLLCGSRGGLAVLVEASLKLAPAPAARALLMYEATPEQLADRPRWSALRDLDPAGVTILGRAIADMNPVTGTREAFTLAIGFEDDAAWVEMQEQRTIDALGAPRLRLHGNDVVSVWQTLADREELPGARLTMTTADHSPAAIAFLLGEAVASRTIFHAAAGRLHLFPDAAMAPALAARAAGSGFSLIGARGAEIKGTLEPRVLALRQSIRSALDPKATLALGERWERGGLGG